MSSFACPHNQQFCTPWKRPIVDRHSLFQIRSFSCPQYLICKQRWNFPVSHLIVLALTLKQNVDPFQTHIYELNQCSKELFGWPQDVFLSPTASLTSSKEVWSLGWYILDMHWVWLWKQKMISVPLSSYVSKNNGYVPSSIWPNLSINTISMQLYLCSFQALHRFITEYNHLFNRRKNFLEGSVDLNWSWYSQCLALFWLLSFSLNGWRNQGFIFSLCLSSSHIDV